MRGLSAYGFCCCGKIPHPDQFRKEGAYFSSQLQETVPHVRVTMTAGTWSRESHPEPRAESSVCASESGVCAHAFDLLSSSDLKH